MDGPVRIRCQNSELKIRGWRLEEGRAKFSELFGLNEQWMRAWLEKDAATVERLMAEDYVYIGPSGLVLDRQAILAIICSPSYRLDHGTRTDVVVRALGVDAAIVRHRCQAAGSFEGTSFTDDHRGVMVWEKQAGQWRVVMDQSSFSRQCSRPRFGQRLLRIVWQGISRAFALENLSAVDFLRREDFYIATR